MTKKSKRMHGTVDKVIKPLRSGEPEKAQITIREADHLYREVRVENVLTDAKGEVSKLREGADVDVIVEADTDAMMKKPT